MVSEPLTLSEARSSVRLLMEASKSSLTEGRLSANCSLWGENKGVVGGGDSRGMTGEIIRGKLELCGLAGCSSALSFTQQVCAEEVEKSR